MASKNYRRVHADVKIQALKEHIMEKQSVSEICKKFDIQPSAFYSWQQELFMRGASIFEKKPGPRAVDKSQERIAALEARLAKKDGVIAELLQEHVELKKSLGES